MSTSERPHLIIGCGYTGLALARVHAEAGHTVIGTSRTDMRQAEVEGAGASFVAYDLDNAKALPPGGPFESITVLAPAPDDFALGARRMRMIAEQAGETPIVVLISTAIFGDTSSTITERTHPAAKTLRAKQWSAMDAAALYMRQRGHDIRLVRTPAIYGPGRDHRARLLTRTAFAIDGASPTSRIHVEDLANIVAKMGTKNAPPMIIACDELPAPTIRVMEEAARLLDLPGPVGLSIDEAKEKLSERGMQMRLGGHSCRSLVRPYLGVRLRYPTYREGLRACLRGTSSRM